MLASIRHGQWKNRGRTLVSFITSLPGLLSAWMHFAFVSADVVILTGGRDFITQFPLVLRKRHYCATVPQTTDWPEIPSCRLMCNIAERTFAISREVAASIQRMGIPDHKIDVLPMIFTRDKSECDARRSEIRKNLKLSGASPILVMAGVVRPHKGQLNAVQVVEFLALTEPGATLLIVGAAPHDAPDALAYEQRVKQYVTENHLLQNVRFLGWRDDLPEILRACDFMLVPSHDYEGVPRVILEGLEAGVPIIGSELPQFRDVLLDAGAGFLRPINQPEDWSHLITQLWNDRKAFQEAKTASRRAWEKFYSEDAARTRLVPAIKALATRRKAPRKATSAMAVNS